MAYPSEKLNNAVDLSHHISDYGKRFKLSPLKGLQKYFGRDDMIVLAGGTPHPAVFPFSQISADVLIPESFPIAPSTGEKETSAPFSWLWRLFGYDHTKERTTPITVAKPAVKGDAGINLTTALQYGPATGLAETQRFIHEFSSLVFKPAYADFATLVHTGNTDGWSRCARVLLNPGDTVIAEEWTYPSALANSLPIDIHVLPVPIDGIGMRADALRELLANWDESKGRRPHVMYTVPIGQNPSGATMDLERKKAIYDVCVEFDVIIVEDDPYYFLQMPKYAPQTCRVSEPTVSSDNEAFIASLEPSFLRVDTQGRVVRMDTFSKTIAPGMRLGWFTCSPLLAERFERIGETSTQSPCGLGQSLAMQLMRAWGMDGYLRWLRGIRAQYIARRDYFVDALAQAFELERRVCTNGIWAGAEVYTAYARPRGGFMMREKTRRAPLFEFVPPTSGMFVWVKIDFSSHPSRLRAEPEGDGDETLEMQFWTHLADAGVLVAPGWFFSAHIEDDGTQPNFNTEGHLRMSFSMATTDQMTRGMKLFEKTLREFFEL